MSRRFKTPASYQVDERSFEHQTDRLSLTVPDEALSIRDILTRFTKGLLDETVMKDAIFDPRPSLDDYDLEKVRAMDPVDQDSVRQSLKEKSTALKHEIRRQQDEINAVREEMKKKKESAAKDGEPNASDAKSKRSEDAKE